MPDSRTRTRQSIESSELQDFLRPELTGLCHYCYDGSLPAPPKVCHHLAIMSTRSRLIAAVLLALSLSAPAFAAPRHELGRALLTFYWIIDESRPRYRGKADADLKNAHGRVIAHTTRRFRRDLIMEGTGWLKDGRTVMYDRRVNGEIRFRIARSKYGIGSLGRPLRPYRTVAVDPRIIKLESKVYIPELKGTCLPDGTIHDGIFVASDRGHFRGMHVDIFVGAGSKSAEPFARNGYGSRSHVTVYLLDSE